MSLRLPIRLPRLTLATKLALAGALIVAMTVCATAWISLTTAKDTLAHKAQENLDGRLHLMAEMARALGPAKRVDNVLTFGDTPMNGNMALVDRVTELAGGVATVFMGDERIATTVKKPDGSRAVGTKLAPGPAFDAVFKEKKTYRGEAAILGEPYLTVYDPIIGPDGQPIGILFVGLKKSEFLSTVDTMLARIAMAGSVATLLGAGLLILLVRGSLRPVNRLRQAMRSMEAGDYATPLPAPSGTRDIDGMVEAFAVLRDGLADRHRLSTEAARERSVREDEQRLREAEASAALARQTDVSATQAAVVRSLAKAMRELADGNLSYRLSERFPAEYAGLDTDFNQSVQQLAATIDSLKQTADELAVTAREIHSGASDLSNRTSQQASSLEETAATTEQLAASVKASAQSSRQAVELARQAMGVATDGGSIVRDAVEAMARIEQASQKISDITGVIDEIAFQTNLLALNAAVEAARAGEAGKGFAVVAAEVRTLAQRSSEAAKDITGLIGASGAEVAQGVKLVRDAGDVLERIVEASRKVSNTVSDISTASSEQANGIDEMSQAIAHMDEMTQQNAALAEESAASATSLTSQIDQLNRLVVAFRTSEHAAQQTAAAGGLGGAGGAVVQRLRDKAAQAGTDLRRPPATRPASPARAAAGGGPARATGTVWEEF